MGARGGAWARACACAYMRNARTFAASASSWSTRARRIAFSSSTVAEEGSEGEEEGGEEDEEEGGEEDEEAGGEEDEGKCGEEDELLAPLLLGFLLCFPPPPPAPSPLARVPRLRAASLLGGTLVAGQRRRQSSAHARAAAARARTRVSICHKVHWHPSCCTRDTPCTGSCCERTLCVSQSS